MRGSQLQQERWKAPDWWTSESYGDVYSWSNRRWAWEFLRRNPAYQNVSKFDGAPPKLQLLYGRPFGRKKIRAYWREYDKSDEERGVWLLDEVEVSCLVSCDHIPRRSWPLFRAKAMLGDLIAGFSSPGIQSQQEQLAA